MKEPFGGLFLFPAFCEQDEMPLVLNAEPVPVRGGDVPVQNNLRDDAQNFLRGRAAFVFSKILLCAADDVRQAIAGAFARPGGGVMPAGALERDSP
jgi:hypothetical protein